jgi:hypothetical protein
MTINEEDQMIEQIMANHNVAMAATAVLPHLDKGKVIECEVSDEDFIQSSG